MTPDRSAVDERVVACFRSVFPDRDTDELAVATPESEPEWDSLAALTLIEVLQEEFDVLLADDVVERLDSVPKVQGEIATLLGV